MIDDEVNIPLGKIFKRRLLRKDHSEKSVDILHTAFPAAAHGITVIDSGTHDTVNAGLQRIRVSKFSAPVGQYQPEDSEKRMQAKPLLKSVEHKTYSAFCIAVHQKCKEQFFLSEIKGQEGLFGLS